MPNSSTNMAFIPPQLQSCVPEAPLLGKCVRCGKQTKQPKHGLYPSCGRAIGQMGLYLRIIDSANDDSRAHLLSEKTRRFATLPKRYPFESEFLTKESGESYDY